MYLYEAIITKDETGYYFGSIPCFDGCFSDGRTLEELAENLAETLKLIIAEYIDSATPLPEQFVSLEQGKLAIGVDVDEEFVQRSKCLTVTEAATYLGVSKGRISQLLTSGKLQSVSFGKDRLVTIASLNSRLSSEIKTGRSPKSGFEYTVQTVLERQKNSR